MTVAIREEGRMGTAAGLLSRGIALWIDLMVVSLFVAIATAAVRSTLDLIGIDADPEGAVGPVVLVITSTVIAFGYYTAGFTFFGRTVGKLLLGLRVVRADGRNPSVLHSAVRTLGYAISSILFLGFLWAGVDRRHQAWHDKLARTFVVYAWDARTAALHIPQKDQPLVPRV
jgi:uncharacterized RDD family membrane protein YckC